MPDPISADTTDIEPTLLDPHGPALRQVKGWFRLADRRLFEWFLERQQARGQHGELVEVGAFEGKSAILIGAYLGEGETLTVVDLFERSAGDDANSQENQRSYKNLTQQAFESNYLKFHAELPTVHAGPSSDVADLVTPGSVRFLHIDASHLYAHVAVDIDIARTLLQPDGVVVLDDYRSAHTPGVAAAVWEGVLNKGMRPICVSKSKMYATWSDPTEVQDDLIAWLSKRPRTTVRIEEIAGRRVVRCVLRPRRPAGQRRGRAPQAATPTSALGRLRLRLTGSSRR
ncbi:class I SAM-dependent methyltransferase [Nocardioides terrisoli]|uniref:class I SAM-dependent methyltransferase n=1 Tax=Nocardioides terrisoli TaxID=3388267 RepID=UPI00287B9058|nr:class I SAM-dependent methyltransferase [Nocardioides marmorisolisilvae]